MISICDFVASRPNSHYFGAIEFIVITVSELDRAAHHKVIITVQNGEIVSIGLIVV